MQLSEGLCLLSETIKYPLGFPPSPNIKGHFEFSPPAKIKVVGSYLLETNLRNTPNVNLTVEIPQVLVEERDEKTSPILMLVPLQICLQEKDYLNYRLFHKRALYISIIAGHLIKKKNLISSIQFTYDLHYPLLPILVLTPKGTRVHVHWENVKFFVSKDPILCQKLLSMKV